MTNDVRNKRRFDGVAIQEYACEKGLFADDPDEAIEPGRRC